MITSGRHGLTSEAAGHSQLEFVRLWTSASPRVHSYLVTLIFNWADAEDLLQDVGVTAWEKFLDYDPDRDFLTWVKGIARNKVLTFRQKRSWSCLVQSEELLARIEQAVEAEPYSLDARHHALQVCLERLTDAERRLLSVSQSQADTLKSVAEQSGRSAQSLYKAVQRIRSQLFQCVTRRLAAGGDA